jgi:Zn-dependent protease
VALRVHWSWLPAAALAVGSLALVAFPALDPGWSPSAYWLAGALAALGSLGSIVGHELAHAGVASSRGVKVDQVTLFVFGGVARATGLPARPRDEIAIAAAGPAASLGLAGVAAGAGWLATVAAEGSGWSAAALLPAVCWQVAVVNAVLTVFNLVPAFPLDGGRIARALLWHATGSRGRATRWAVSGGRAAAAALLLWGIYQLAGGGLLVGAWTASLGLFLDRAALAASHEGVEPRP